MAVITWHAKNSNTALYLYINTTTTAYYGQNYICLCLLHAPPFVWVLLFTHGMLPMHENNTQVHPLYRNSYIHLYTVQVAIYPTIIYIQLFVPMCATMKCNLYIRLYSTQSFVIYYLLCKTVDILTAAGRSNERCYSCQNYCIVHTHLQLLPVLEQWQTELCLKNEIIYETCAVFCKNE